VIQNGANAMWTDRSARTDYPIDYLRATGPIWPHDRSHFTLRFAVGLSPPGCQLSNPSVHASRYGPVEEGVARAVDRAGLLAG
jgi:hypothetical protein